MTNTEATVATKTAAVAEPGAHVAPEKGAAKRAASQKKAAPKANLRRQEGGTRREQPKPVASRRAAKKPVKPARKKAAPPATEGARGIQESHDPATPAPPQRRNLDGDRRGHKLAEPQHPGLPQRQPAQEDGPDD
jgi:hypothetical protein